MKTTAVITEASNSVRSVTWVVGVLPVKLAVSVLGPVMVAVVELFVVLARATSPVAVQLLKL